MGATVFFLVLLSLVAVLFITVKSRMTPYKQDDPHSAPQPRQRSSLFNQIGTASYLETAFYIAMTVSCAKFTLLASSSHRFKKIAATLLVGGSAIVVLLVDGSQTMPDRKVKRT
jgi:hypothetical protein